MRLLLISLFFFGSVGTSLALSYGTPDSMFASAMAANMETPKKIPDSWEEMEIIYGEPLDEKFRHILPTKRYVFIKEDVRIFNGDRVLLMTRSPFRDVRLYTRWYGGIGHGLRKRGRWVIVKTEKYGLRARYFEEKEKVITDAFARAGISLPAPDGLGPRPHEVEYDNSQKGFIIFVCFIFGLATVVVFIIRAENKQQPAPKK